MVIRFVLLVVCLVSNAHGAKIIVPAHLQYLVNVKDSHSQIDSPEHYVYSVFFDLMQDQEIEIIYSDQKIKSEKQLYTGEVAGSLFLSEQTKDSNLSDHFLYSNPIIQSGQWKNGIFSCYEKHELKSDSNYISVLSTQTQLLTSLKTQFDFQFKVEKSWVEIINNCKQDRALIVLPLSMVNKKIMGQSVYWAGESVNMIQSFHIVFSNQHPKGGQLQKIFNLRLNEYVLPSQSIPK
ncbi:hypothetical protein [Marinicellulosiphila megalodicopiae]|uniref:hypothetical protein n=1 Tax=Marinicellulosiphila megalodicopiae TaxID=2724896 RepID=UPI003BB1A0F2